MSDQPYDMNASDEDDEKGSNEQALEWLSGMDPGSIVGWNTHHFSLREPFTKGWVDVMVPEAQQALGWNWVWTVEQSDNPEILEDPFSFVCPFDATLEMIMPKGKNSGTPEQVWLRHDSGEALDLSYLVSDDEWSEYRKTHDDWEQQRDWYWESFQATEPMELDGLEYPAGASLDQRDDRLAYLVRVWTPHAISAGLRDWCKNHGWDIEFQWNPELPEAPHLQEARRRLEAYRNGELETYAIGENVSVVAPAMDWLLSLPMDQAAEITRTLNSLQSTDDEE